MSSNGCVIGNEEKEAMNATGRFMAPGQTVTDDDVVVGAPPESDTASFWVSGLCSPFRTFGDRAASYVEAWQSGDPDKIQTVVNAGFGEIWTPTGGDVPEWKEVEDRSLPYAKGTVPEGVLFLTAGVDVQKRKLVYVDPRMGRAAGIVAHHTRRDMGRYQARRRLVRPMVACPREELRRPPRVACIH